MAEPSETVTHPAAIAIPVPTPPTLSPLPQATVSDINFVFILHIFTKLGVILIDVLIL